MLLRFGREKLPAELLQRLLVHLIAQPCSLSLVADHVESPAPRLWDHFEVVDVVATAEGSHAACFVVEGRSSSPSSEYAAGLLEALVVEGLSRVLSGLCAFECGLP